MKIRSDIPEPKRKRKYPFAEMKIGESVWIPDISQQNVTAYVYSLKDLRQKKFTTQKQRGGVRVWRTS